jgi:hypothetical protein
MRIKKYNNNKTKKLNKKKYQKGKGKGKNKSIRNTRKHDGSRHSHSHSHNLKNTPIELNKVNCSPKDKKEIKNYTCYTDTSLFKLRDKWNLRHPDVKIVTNDSKEIHKLLSNYLSDVCNKESC